MPASPPKINAEQLDAVIDALITMNALLFTVLASPKESDAALQLLDRLTVEKTPTLETALQLHVLRETAAVLRELREVTAESHHDESRDMK